MSDQHGPPEPDAPEPDEPDLDDLDEDRRDPADDLPEGPPHPVNWNLLSAHDLEVEWLELNRWVDWLRHTYGLAIAVLPPFWHRHPEMVWELSALHLHWLCAYDPEQNGSAPIGWHRDFVDAKQRLRDWVTACSTRLDHDRATRQVSWPGEPKQPENEAVYIPDRDADFVEFVQAQVRERQAAEDDYFTTLDTATGELRDLRDEPPGGW